MASHQVEQALRKTLSAITADSEETRLYVGLSGGVDSVVLLFACKQLIASWPDKKLAIHAIHVNHGLSKLADAWQQHVADLCLAWNIPLSSHKVDVSTEGSLEKAARDARYGVFKRVLKDQDFLLLGHHQDDQIETMMQRLMRGSGLSGLLSMKSSRALSLDNDQQAVVMRPFLSLSKQTIKEYARLHQLSFVEDDSNQDERFDRNFWRLQALPLIEKRYPQYRQSIQSSLDALQEEHSALQYFLQQAVLDMTVVNTVLQIKSLSQYPRSIQQQILRHWLWMNQVFPLPTHPQLETIFDEVLEAKLDSDPRFQWHTHVLARFNGCLYLLDADLLTIDQATLPTSWQGEDLDTGFVLLRQIKDQGDGGVGLKPDCYQLVWGNPGERVRPLGRSSKSYKKLMQEANIPPWQRSLWPILIKQGQVAAVPGICVCEGFSQAEGWQLGLKFNLNKK